MALSPTGVVPIYINNFNWLTCTRNLADFCAALPRTEIVIVDNASTYPPLLDWYREACPYQVVRLTDNCGEHAPWNCGVVLSADDQRARFGSEYYVVTDPDLSLQGCPADVLEVLADGLLKYPTVNKVGLSLEIEDLPTDQPLAMEAQAWERQFWSHRRDERFFHAGVDTTFALYSVHTPRALAQSNDSNALRTDRPYTARHLPWYAVEQSLTVEEEYYFKSVRYGAWGIKWKQRLESATA